MLKVIKANVLNPKASNEKSLVCFLVIPVFFFFDFVAGNFKLPLFHIVPLVGKHAQKLILELPFCSAGKSFSVSLSPMRKVIWRTYYAPQIFSSIGEAEDPFHLSTVKGG